MQVSGGCILKLNARTRTCRICPFSVALSRGLFTRDRVEPHLACRERLLILCVINGRTIEEL